MKKYVERDLLVKYLNEIKYKTFNIQTENPKLKYCLNPANIINLIIAETNDIGVSEEYLKLYLNMPNTADVIHDHTNHNIITQDDFVWICDNRMQDTLDIGKKIKLNNHMCGETIFEVIGVNHDDSFRTVDIMATEQITSLPFGDCADYSYSIIRHWLNYAYFIGFDKEIRSLSKTMSVITEDDSTTVNNNDHVKILSGTEIGATASYLATGEGAKYEAFEYDGTEPIKSAWRPGVKDESDTVIWLRSQSTIGTNNVWGIGSDGYLVTHSYYSNMNGILPVLRF